MSAPQRKKISISLMIPFLVFIMFFSIMIWGKYRSSYEVPAPQQQPDVEYNRTVTLFFVADGIRLARESREIDPCEGTTCLKSVLDELLNGPVGEFEETLPEGTVVNSVTLEGDMAIIDFNSTFAEAMMPGSFAEMMAVYSVVNSVTTNFPQIQEVKLNVEGNSSAVLHHLDLSDPLVPDYSLEQLHSTVPDNTINKTTTKSRGSKQ